nr:MAG: capsid protein [Cressdnaviricota sp.]
MYTRGRRRYSTRRRYGGFRRRTTFGGRKRFYRRRFSHPQKNRFATAYPDRRICKFVFHDSYAIGATGFAAWTFRGNSLYDPDFGVGGGQPSGYANWSRMFNYYDVRAARCTVNILWSAAFQANVGLAAVPMADYTQLIANQAAFENCCTEILKPAHRAVFKEFFPNNSYTSSRNGPWISLYAKTNAVTRLPHDINEIAAFGNNPANQWYFVIGFGAFSQNQLLNMSANMSIKITYYAVLKQRSLSNYDA